jgi:hypothetical protein
MQNGSTMLRRLGLSCKIKLIESDQIRQPTLVEEEGRYPIDTGTALKIGEHGTGASAAFSRRLPP